MTIPSTDEAFARKLTACLNEAEQNLPYLVTERLRASREQALAQHNPKAQGQWAKAREYRPSLAPAHTSISTGTGPVLSLGGLGTPQQASSQRPGPTWLQRLLTGLPLLALAFGLISIGAHTDRQATSDLADLDTALLTSDLPPSAYADPGFLHFLQTSDTTVSTQQP